MDFRLPELGEGLYEAELVAWQVQPGDQVKRGQNLMEVLTDKATMEVPAPFAGTVTQLRAQPGQSIKVGTVVLEYTPTSDGRATPDPWKDSDQLKAEPAPQPVRPAAVQTAMAASAGEVRAAPSVRYLARKLGIDLRRVPGSGPGGRVLIEDLSPHTQPGPAAAKTPEPGSDYGRPGSRIKMQGVRRKIAEHLVLAKRTIPHYSYVDECEVTELVRLRDGLRETFAQAGTKLTYLAFFVKAAVGALQEIPIVNASLDEASAEIVLHDKYHIGIAVATPSGLMVPVIHDADQKSLAQIARDIERLSAEARAGKIRLEDLRGGTFTITSVGNIGGLISTPVIHHPEVAILGIGKIVKRPVYDAAGQLRPADLLYLSLSFDHRVVDGAVGAAFGNALRRRLENPDPLAVTL